MKKLIQILIFLPLLTGCGSTSTNNEKIESNNDDAMYIGEYTGTVKWFNENKGYGFITSDDGEDLFVHYTEIVTEGFATLKEGESVHFNIEETERGRVAVDIEVNK